MQHLRGWKNRVLQINSFVLAEFLQCQMSFRSYKIVVIRKISKNSSLKSWPDSTTLRRRTLVWFKLVYWGQTGLNNEHRHSFQAFELSTLDRIRNAGSRLRLIFLLNKMEKTSNSSLDDYKNKGYFGLGLDKDLLVIKDGENHINFTNEALINRVHMNNNNI